ncbi:hypothetical protein NKI77_30215 [Mesorhizobium opportunistum]|uniref:Uncharacterized protein n=1 Tax=Mesorhizobium opportunistum TaxID=593909 RepID=A0ABV1YQ75_9HYPH|nr:hypothetical protein [Mesorhizobium sp.]TIN92857.1 MAG: hypothetical protein E5Y06_22130 [Mesorhizobium sp.]TJU97258.1 MAG: hypothetical protein E5Y08_17105 [Mesorhizobium sp.]TJV16622.1 MAG: hypothetical protein E5Y07_17600 [Mesorhizobium sp.]
MSEKATGRQEPGTLESAAIVLAIAVASLAMARAEPGQRRCAAMAAPVHHEATPAKPAPDDGCGGHAVA